MEQILAQLKAIVDAAEAESRDLTEEETSAYEALEVDLARAQKSAEIVKRNAAYSTVVTPRVNMGGVTGDAHTRAFDAWLRGNGDRGMTQYRAQSEGTASAGGFLVPVTFTNRIVEHLKAFGGLQNAAQSISTADGRPLTWLTNDEVLSTNAEITAENATWSTGADLSFGNRTLNAYKYTTVGASTLPLKVPFELLADAEFDLVGFIAKKFAERIARKLANDLVNGTGVNEPQGLISTQGGLTNSGVTIASATAGPTYGELVTIKHSLDPAYRMGARWIFNDATMAKIEALVDTAGRPLIWNSNVDLTAGSVQTLLGYPIVIDQAMPDMLTGSTKGMVFGRLEDAYIVRTCRDMTMVQLNELYAQSGQVAFLGWARYDGMVQDPNAAVYVTSHA